MQLTAKAPEKTVIYRCAHCLKPVNLLTSEVHRGELVFCQIACLNDYTGTEITPRAVSIGDGQLYHISR